MKTISVFSAEGQPAGGQDLRVDKMGDLQIVDGLESVRQRVIESLRFWLGEWYVDVDDGAPYRSDIFSRPTSSGLAGVIVSDRIRGVDGVSGVSNVVVTIDPLARRMTYTARITSPFGSFTTGGEIG